MERALILVVLAVFIAVGGYCGYRYYNQDILPEKQLSEADDKQLELFERVKPKVLVSYNGKTETEKTDHGSPLQSAEEVNSDVVGWLTIPDTHIDYPIAQAEDNDFYLHNGFDGEYNYELGCPFLDYRCEVDFKGFNSIVYAHNMTHDRMFSDIGLYKDEALLEGHRYGFLAGSDGVHDIEFFAYLSIPSTAPAYHAVFVTDGEKQDYIDYICDTAKYCTMDSAEISTDMHLILLSTCTFEYKDARRVLVGVIR